MSDMSGVLRGLEQGNDPIEQSIVETVAARRQHRLQAEANGENVLVAQLGRAVTMDEAAWAAVSPATESNQGTVYTTQQNTWEHAGAAQPAAASLSPGTEINRSRTDVTSEQPLNSASNGEDLDKAAILADIYRLHDQSRQ